MLNLDRHPYFTKYADEQSGVVSYILTEHVAALQQSFYFSQPSVTEDGKYLWIMCANPPARYRTLAVVSLDCENPFIRHFPHASPSGSCNLPCITPAGDGCYFGIDNAVYKVDVEGAVTKVLEVPLSHFKQRPIERLFTHASVSCDNKYIALDMGVSDKTYVGIGCLETGEVKLLNKFGRMYDHALFSPTDPELILIDQDWWIDSQSGEYFPIDNRMWLLNTKGDRFEPLIPTMFYGRDGSEMAHDYWSRDGYVCWSDYHHGAYECDLKTKVPTLVWRRPICHSHTSADRQLFVGDQSPYTWAKKPCQVLFYDRATNKEIPIFSALPCPAEFDRFYHQDPHPQFCANDSVVVCTTTVFGGRIDVAITPVAPLLEKCRSEGTSIPDTEYVPAPVAGWVANMKKPFQ